MQRLTSLSRGKKILATFFVIGLVLFTTLIGLRIAYYGRIYPGVSANGVYLGGLKADEAMRELNSQTSNYSARQIEIVAPQAKQTISADQLGVIYNNSAAVSEAMQVGRSGWMIDRFISQFIGLLGLNPTITYISYDTSKLSNVLVDINTRVSKPVENARFITTNGDVQTQESTRGKRVDYALAPQAINNHFGQLQTKLFVLPLLVVEPQLNTVALQKQKSIITPFAKQPLELTHGSKKWTADVNTIVGWLSLQTSNQPTQNNLLNNYYTLSKATDSNLVFYDRKAVREYVASLADEINVAPIDAQLTINGGRATIFKQSRDGKTLDVEKSTDSIMRQLSLALPTPIPLTVATNKAEVSDGNIENLGIKELISEGVSYFPGSSSNRIQNIRVGTSRFNGVLIKPGEVFSFNKYLGEVSAAAGYAEGIVILENKEEKQYGGGLCQVSSTAYRAALLAGLPILSRTNHAFAVSYYTEPFGVPGVDATIYLPNPDMQFKNDTGKHILIQTELIGTTLKFRFYGTKTKSGVIRGPFFLSGSQDHTKPSETVFYRDVVDLNGNVIKTDTTSTYYKSSLDFPLIN